MIFNQHSGLQGKHAFLSASSYHWVNYSNEKLAERYDTYRAAARGTQLHELAHDLVKMGVRLPRTKATLNQYVNDAIGFKMDTEQILFYSYNAFGTADAISFRKNLLRIHDYKSGTTKVSMMQLRVYAALFCLEYGLRPGTIDMELRIYFQDDVIVEIPDVDEIAHIMERIVTFDRLIDNMKAEAGE